MFDPQVVIFWIQLDNKFDWLGLVYGVVYPILMDRLGKNRKNDEEIDEDCVEKEFPLARVKSYINGGGGRKAIVMGNCSINV